jgi:hypothetical protein
MTQNTLSTVSVGRRTFTILFPDLIPPLSADELARLRESIICNGVVNPIVVDEDDGVIDGGNRLRIAAELDAPSIPAEVRAGLTHEKKIELAYSLNADRRHMSAATLKRLKEERVARVAAARQEGKSIRAIAEAAGVSKTQVERDLSEAKATVPSGTVEPVSGVVVGRDGKRRPAARRTEERGPAGETDDGGAPTPEEPPSVPQQQPPEEVKPDDAHKGVWNEEGSPLITRDRNRLLRRIRQALRIMAPVGLRQHDLVNLLGRTLPSEFAFRSAVRCSDKQSAEVMERDFVRTSEAGRYLLIREVLQSLCKQGDIKETVDPDNAENPAYVLTTPRVVYDPNEQEAWNSPPLDTLSEWAEEDILDLLTQVVRRYARERKEQRRHEANGRGGTKMAREQRKLVNSVREDVEYLVDVLAGAYDCEDADTTCT